MCVPANAQRGHTSRVMLFWLQILFLLVSGASGRPCMLAGPFIRYHNARNGVWKGTILVVTPPTKSLVLKYRSEGATKESSVAAVMIDTYTVVGVDHGPTKKYQFWRAQLVLRQSSVPRAITYHFPALSTCGRFSSKSDKKFTYHVPAANQNFHWGFFSCQDDNPYFAPNYAKDFPLGSSTTWQALLDLHAQNPFHLLVGLGDQIYNDGVLHEPALKRIWNKTRKPRDRAKLWKQVQFTAVVKKQVEDFFMTNYLQKFTHPVMSIAFASIPMSHVWDDHEVFDGFNNQDPSIVALPVYQKMVLSGMRFFKTWQLHYGPAAPSGERFLQPGFTTLKAVGPDTAVLILDTRWERNRDHFISPASYDAVMAQLNQLKTGQWKFLFVMTAESLVTMKWPKVAQIIKFPLFSALSKTFSPWGDAELLDDASDFWGWPTRVSERASFIARLQALANDKSMRIIFAGGDAHSTYMGGLKSKKKTPPENDHRYMPGFTSSAIGVSPISSSLCKLYNTLARTKWTILDGSTSSYIDRAFRNLNVDSKCGDYWLNHRNFAEISRLPDGQINVKIWVEADSKYSSKPFQSYGKDVPALTVLT